MHPKAFLDACAELVEGDAISAVIKTADYPKCARSWRKVPDVGSDAEYPDLSARDADTEAGTGVMLNQN